MGTEGQLYYFCKFDLNFKMTSNPEALCPPENESKALPCQKDVNLPHHTLSKDAGATAVPLSTSNPSRSWSTQGPLFSTGILAPSHGSPRLGTALCRRATFCSQY